MIVPMEMPRGHEGVVHPPLHFERNGGDKVKTPKIEDDKERQRQREKRRREKLEKNQSTGDNKGNDDPTSPRN